MKFSNAALVFATVALTSTAAFAAGGLHKHDASIANHSYNIPIIDASSTLNRPGTSLREDIERGYQPQSNPTPFTQTAPQQQPRPAAPAQGTVQQQKPAAASQQQGSFSDVARGVTPTQHAVEHQPAAQAPASAQEPVTLSTPDQPAVAPQQAPQANAPQGASAITVTGDNADGLPAGTPATP